MNFKNISQFLINPFTRIAGWQAFGVGVVFLVLMGVVGTFSGVCFDGALDVHFTTKSNFCDSFLFLAVDIVCVTLFMWLGAVIFSKNVRLIDLLGTMTLSKAPLLIVTFAGFLISKNTLLAIEENPLAVLGMPAFIYFSVAVMVPFFIWTIALMYNAFKVSSGIKGDKIVPVFIVALLLAEVASKIIISFTI